MGRALPPQHDAGERELPPQSPPCRAGGPATLRVLILALLWRGSLAQLPGFTLTVPQSVSVQEGLCVLVPCTFTYPASSVTDNPSARLYETWYKEPATVGQDSPVASSVPAMSVSQETQGRFRLAGDPARGDCSLQISDARRTDMGRYFLNIEKGLFDHTYRSNSYGAGSALTISVPGLTEEPEIQISPARGLPGTLVAGEPVTVTCTAPGRCSWPPPRVTWMGPFSDTARNVSAQLVNGTWAHSSALSFTPGLGDHGKELVCNVTYRPPRGPSTRRTIRLHIVYPTEPPNTTGTRNGRPDTTEPPNTTGNQTSNGHSDSPRPGTGLNSSCQRQGPSISCSCSLRSHPSSSGRRTGRPWLGMSHRGPCRWPHSGIYRNQLQTRLRGDWILPGLLPHPALLQTDTLLLSWKQKEGQARGQGIHSARVWRVDWAVPQSPKSRQGIRNSRD